MTMRRNRLRPRPATGPGSRNDPRVLVALPAFNEVDSVGSVLHAVRTYASDILVVDDGSTDGTGAALDRCPWLRRITHERNLGYGRSLIEAFAYAVRHGFEWVITIDCDHQHEPSRIPLFRRAIERNAWDIISGSRYLRRRRPSSRASAAGACGDQPGHHRTAQQT